MKSLPLVITVVLVLALGIAGCSQTQTLPPKADTSPAPPNLTTQQAEGIVVAAIRASTPTIRASSGWSSTKFNSSTRQWMVTVWASENDSKQYAGAVYVVDDATGKLLNPPPGYTPPSTATIQPTTPAPTTPAVPNASTTTPATTQPTSPTKVMPNRTAKIGATQYPNTVFSPVLPSSNWVVSYFEKAGELPIIPNSLLPLFTNSKVGDKLPLNVEIPTPSLQFWNRLLPSERQTMLDIVEWYGMPAADFLWVIQFSAPT